MNRQIKVSDRRIIALIFLLAAMILNQITLKTEYLIELRSIAVSFGCLVSLSIWALYSIQRCGEKQLKYCLICEYCCMAVLFMIRCIKYNTADSVFTLYLWYISYLPIILLPFVAFLSTVTIETGNRINTKYGLFFIPGAVLATGILTNNYHELAFSFKNGSDKYASDYTRGILYYLVLIWIVAFFAATMVNAFRKCHLSSRRSGRNYLIALLATSVLLVLYYFNGPFILRTYIIGFYEVPCLFYVMLNEICLDYGMFPTNDYDEHILRNSSLWMTVTDKADQVKYVPNDKLSIEHDILVNAKAGPVIIDNRYELIHHEISGGNAYFAENISSVLELNEKLEEAKSILLEEQTILNEETAAREKIKITEHTSRIYEMMDSRLSYKSDLIRRLISEVDENNWKEKFGKVSIVAAFMKRQGNLMILSEQSKTVSPEELALCFSESIRYINNYGIFGSFSMEESESINISEALCAYETFENVMECVWDNISAVLVKISGKTNGFELYIELGGNVDRIFLPETAAISIDRDGENDTTFVRASFKKEATE